MSAELARIEFTDDQVGLIRRTLCKDATNDELTMFLGQCRRTGLDPIARQIHAVKRGGKLVIQVGIDGLRLIATRTGQADGQDGPYFCGDDGVWKDVWFGKTPPAAAKVIVHRKGQSRGYTGIAVWAEFNQPTDPWRRMPTVMLAKVAESIALRKAFPAELSGLYAPEEFGDESPAESQHNDPAPAVKQLAAAPAPAPATTGDARPDPRKADYDRAAADLKAAAAKSCDALHAVWVQVYKAGKATFGENLFAALETLKDELKAKCQQAPPATGAAWAKKFEQDAATALSMADVDDLNDRLNEAGDLLTDAEYKTCADAVQAAYDRAGKVPAGK